MSNIVIIIIIRKILGKFAKKWKSEQNCVYYTVKK